MVPTALFTSILKASLLWSLDHYEQNGYSYLDQFLLHFLSLFYDVYWQSPRPGRYLLCLKLNNIDINENNNEGCKQAYSLYMMITEGRKGEGVFQVKLFQW